MRHLIDINELLGKYFAGEELTESETMELENYKSANQKEFMALTTAMAQTESATSDLNIDTDRAWKKVEKRLCDHNDKVKIIPLRKIMSIAASLLLIIGISTFVYQKFFNDNSLHFANNTLKETLVTLDDGSHVTLAPKATLSFEEKDGLRVAELKGKAFFDIEHDDKTFIVNAGILRVKVLGTSFTINAEEKGKEIIKVASGRVSVTTDGKEVVLVKGETAACNAGKLVVQKHDNTPKEAKVFVFDNTPLLTAVKTIEQEMDVRIEIGTGLNNNSITTKLQTDQPEEVVSELALLCNCKYDVVSSIHFRLHK